ncbi:hypothetical protein [uncultured Gelidibacter sp.]|nr:hypothetical protein [uncultured Gelidibacter sp.]
MKLKSETVLGQLKNKNQKTSHYKKKLKPILINNPFTAKENSTAILK